MPALALSMNGSATGCSLIICFMHLWLRSLAAQPYFYCFLYFRSGIPGRMACRFQHFGIAALTVGCMINGVLEIYGTTNRLVSVYFIVGGGFLLVGNLMNLL